MPARRGISRCSGEEAIATIKAARLMAASEEARTHREAGKVEGEGMGQGEGEGEGNHPSLDGARPMAELRDAARSPDRRPQDGPNGARGCFVVRARRASGRQRREVAPRVGES